MPSQTVLEQKKAIVAELSERLKSSITGLVVSYKGINTEDDTKLRKELRENDVKYTVVKNTLLARACDEAGLEDLKPVLEGTTALATSDSEYAAAARILCKYAKDHENFKVKSGYLDGAVIDISRRPSPLLRALCRLLLTRVALTPASRRKQPKQLLLKKQRLPLRNNFRVLI